MRSGERGAEGWRNLSPQCSSCCPGHFCRFTKRDDHFPQTQVTILSCQGQMHRADSELAAPCGAAPGVSARSERRYEAQLAALPVAVSARSLLPPFLSCGFSVAACGRLCREESVAQPIRGIKCVGFVTTIRRAETYFSCSLS